MGHAQHVLDVFCIGVRQHIALALQQILPDHRQLTPRCKNPPEDTVNGPSVVTDVVRRGSLIGKCNVVGGFKQPVLAQKVEAAIFHTAPVMAQAEGDPFAVVYDIGGVEDMGARVIVSLGPKAFGFPQ